MTRVRVAIVLLAVLASAALAQEAPSTDKVLLGGPNAVRWGGHDGWRPAGVAAVLVAVRLRFRPEALASPLDDRDVALVGALAEAHPCVDP